MTNLITDILTRDKATYNLITDFLELKTLLAVETKVPFIGDIAGGLGLIIFEKIKSCFMFDVIGTITAIQDERNLFDVAELLLQVKSEKALYQSAVCFALLAVYSNKMGWRIKAYQQLQLEDFKKFKTQALSKARCQELMQAPNLVSIILNNKLSNIEQLYSLLQQPCIENEDLIQGGIGELFNEVKKFIWGNQRDIQTNNDLIIKCAGSLAGKLEKLAVYRRAICLALAAVYCPDLYSRYIAYDLLFNVSREGGKLPNKQIKEICEKQISPPPLDRFTTGDIVKWFTIYKAKQSSSDPYIKDIKVDAATEFERKRLVAVASKFSGLELDYANLGLSGQVADQEFQAAKQSLQILIRVYERNTTEFYNWQKTINDSIKRIIDYQKLQKFPQEIEAQLQRVTSLSNEYVEDLGPLRQTLNTIFNNFELQKQRVKKFLALNYITADQSNQYGVHLVGQSELEKESEQVANDLYIQGIYKLFLKLMDKFLYLNTSFNDLDLSEIEYCDFRKLNIERECFDGFLRSFYNGLWSELQQLDLSREGTTLKALFGNLNATPESWMQQIKNGFKEVQDKIDLIDGALVMVIHKTGRVISQLLLELQQYYDMFSERKKEDLVLIKTMATSFTLMQEEVDKIIRLFKNLKSDENVASRLLANCKASLEADVASELYTLNNLEELLKTKIENIQGLIVARISVLAEDCVSFISCESQKLKEEFKQEKLLEVSSESTIILNASRVKNAREKLSQLSQYFRAVTNTNPDWYASLKDAEYEALEERFFKVLYPAQFYARFEKKTLQGFRIRIEELIKKCFSYPECEEDCQGLLKQANDICDGLAQEINTNRKAYEKKAQTDLGDGGEGMRRVIRELIALEFDAKNIKSDLERYIKLIKKLRDEEGERPLDEYEPIKAKIDEVNQLKGVPFSERRTILEVFCQGQKCLEEFVLAARKEGLLSPSREKSPLRQEELEEGKHSAYLSATSPSSGISGAPVFGGLFSRWSPPGSPAELAGRWRALRGTPGTPVLPPLLSTPTTPVSPPSTPSVSSPETPDSAATAGSTSCSL